MKFSAITIAAFAALVVAKTEKDCMTPNATMCSANRHHIVTCISGKWKKTEDCDDNDLHCDMVENTDAPVVEEPKNGTTSNEIKPSVIAACVPQA